MNPNERLERNWTRLTSLCMEQMINTFADQSMHANYILLLNHLKHDRTHDQTGVIRLGMMRAPASKDRHHRHEGGLVEHLLEMWDAWGHLENTLRSNLYPFTGPMLAHPQITNQNIWRAILHHDLDKVWKYQIPRNDVNPFAVDYAKDHLRDLLGASGKTLYFLQLHSIQVSPALMNAIYASEGGYSTQRPPVETVFAKIVYILDELSANVRNRLENNRFWASKGDNHEEG